MRKAPTIKTKQPITIRGTLFTLSGMMRVREDATTTAAVKLKKKSPISLYLKPN